MQYIWALLLLSFILSSCMVVSNREIENIKSFFYNSVMSHLIKVNAISKNINMDELKSRSKLSSQNSSRESLVHSDFSFISITNFIQLVFPQLVDQFSQTKLHYKASNENYLYIYGMYKSNNKQLRYQVISNYKIFVC